MCDFVPESIKEIYSLALIAMHTNFSVEVFKFYVEIIIYEQKLFAALKHL